MANRTGTRAFSTAALALALILGVSPMAFAADSTGNYRVKGAGTATCERFVEAMNKRDESMFSFAGWLEGFLSGMNRYESDVFDLVSWQSTDLLMVSLAKYCGDNPKTGFQDAAMQLAALLRQNAVAERSDIVTIKAGDKAYLLYAVVVKRMQDRLATKGLYEGETNGAFDDATRAALKKFQEASKLDPTGLPDQITLATLMN